MIDGLLLGIIGHLTGDYILQNDWMALNKKKSFVPCAVHCFVWTVCVCLFTGWVHPMAAVILFGTHFIQDRTTIIRKWMALIGQEQFATGVCAPWSIIVVDNVWHILTIYGVWKWVV